MAIVVFLHYFRSDVCFLIRISNASVAINDNSSYYH